VESDLEVEVFWTFLLGLELALLAWFLLARLRGDAHGGDSRESDTEPPLPSPTPAPPTSIRGWLDHKASILISRRPRTHRHRHKHW
jgi:hypothetical protein